MVRYCDVQVGVILFRITRFWCGLMESDRGSQTALIVSLMRAVHSRGDIDPIINDPFGFDFVTSDERAIICYRLSLKLGRHVVEQLRNIHREDDALAFVIRATLGYGNVIIRTRYTEDRLDAAMTNGMLQYVSLGAGMDSFCFRRPELVPTLKIFEIDHPATQEMKMKRLAAAGLTPPSNVEYISADFERETVGDVLHKSTYDRKIPAFFSWLGVTMYLTRQAIFQTIRSISENASAGSELVFNYLNATAWSPEAKSMKSDTPEPIVSRICPEDVRNKLRDCGFEVLEDVGPAELTVRYCAGRSDGIHLLRNFQLVHARLSDKLL